MTLGIKAGLNMQRTFGSTIFGGSYSQMPMAGIYADLTKRQWAFRVEILAKMARLDYLPYHADLKTSYLDIPLLVQYNIFDVVWLQAGPQYTRMISARNMSSGSNVRGLWFQSNDISLVAGAEVVVLPRLTASARYVHGLLNVNGVDFPYYGRWRNSGLQFALGYRFIH
ncbi:hypothetical protein GCM10023093_25700 [Nemorincola caseinilytica]|uniref:Outer membrane protein beta-barrel domain-containing protein n=1 Tax=Nemorincola caseinilytica TaxID=2054315 RepID=A0ABP8NK90_9BACT